MLFAVSACRRREEAGTPTPTATAERGGVTSLASAPVCNAAQDAEWSYVQNVTLGASARDPVGHNIGKRPARKFILYNNWYPLDVVKQTVCGTLSRYGFYNGLGKEADWNLFLIPSEQFGPLFEAARAHAHTGAPQDCPKNSGLDNCLEAEITPDSGFLENSYFPPQKEPTPQPKQVGNPICAYGPWVGEKLHGFRPEIHPSEVVWWREVVGPGTEHFFLLVQDASGRFDDEDDYGRESEPGGTPWAKAPRTPVLRVAFELPAADPERVLYAHLVGGNILDRTPSPPAENPLVVAGRPVLKVVERRPSGADALAVSFDGVCQDQGATRLRGYIQISTKLGANDEAGFAVLRVGPRDVALPQFRIAPPRIEARNPKRDDSRGPARLVVDLEPVFPSDETRRAPGESAIKDAEVPGDRPGERRRIPASLSEARKVIPSVPVLPGRDTPISLGLESGRQVPLMLPGLAVALLVTDEKPALGTSDPGAWSSMIRRPAARAPGARVIPPAGLTVTTVPSWSIESQIQYAPRRDGELAAEDETPVSEVLNTEVRRGASRELAGGGNLFSIAYRSFVATDLTTGRTVPVVVNEPAGPGRVGVTVATDGVRGVNLRVSFPTAPASHVYRLVATVGLKDVFGHEGELVEEVWSHVFTSGSPASLADALVAAASAIAGLPAERAVTTSRLVLSRLPAGAEREPSQQRARLLRLAAERAAEDGFATPAQLEQLVRVASTMGRSQP